MKLKDIEFGVCGHRKIIDDKTEVRIVINAYTKRASTVPRISIRFARSYTKICLLL